jgi:hypothetical protein
VHEEKCKAEIAKRRGKKGRARRGAPEEEYQKGILTKTANISEDDAPLVIVYTQEFFKMGRSTTTSENSTLPTGD